MLLKKPNKGKSINCRKESGFVPGFGFIDIFNRFIISKYNIIENSIGKIFLVPFSIKLTNKRENRITIPDSLIKQRKINIKSRRNKLDQLNSFLVDWLT